MTPRILVVDDELALVETLIYALEQEQFDVAVASDGRSAINAALTQSIDLVLLDLMLPELPGEFVCREIRRHSHVPIIMLSAKSSETEIIEGLELGADDYITKPFSTAELIGRINAVLRRGRDDRPGKSDFVREVGDLSIDIERDTASIDGRPVQLTPSEFKVLALLARQPGAAYSRRQIMEHLWASRFTGDEHTCQVHISSLRRKLERDPRHPRRILTLRGIGYSLNSASP
jgi:two-component system response regulator RegX3